MIFATPLTWNDLFPDQLPEPFEEQLTRAVEVAELLMGEELFPRSYLLKMDLREDLVLLPTHPVRNIDLPKVANWRYEVRPDLGLFTTIDLPKGIFEIRVEVGYQKEDLPAFIKELILTLIRHGLRPSEETSEKVIVILEIAQADRAAREKERSQINEAYISRIGQRTPRYG